MEQVTLETMDLFNGISQIMVGNMGIQMARIASDTVFKRESSYFFLELMTEEVEQ